MSILFSFQVPKDPDRSLKDNIKSFKAKKDAEERQKRTQEAEKKANLLELRSQNKKSARAANAMVKMTKSAKKLDVKKEVVVESRFQCDNDDYGYESSAANSMFEKLMKKFEANPEDPMAKFKPKRPLEKNISTKFQPFRRPENSSSSSSSKESKSSKTGSSSSSSTSSSSSGSKSSNNAKKNMAPPPSFAELLKLAGNKKKGGPVQGGLDLKKSKDPDLDRPMTQKQREEFMRERNSQLRKEGKLPPSTPSSSSSSVVPKKSLIEDKPVKPTKVASASIPSKENNFQQPCQKPKRPPVITGPEFHPAVMSSKKSKPSRPRSPSPEPLRKKAKNTASNRIESDDEDEYDSEMDDFIDDSDTKMDVSAEIAKMFGYNRHKYRDEDFDDRDMENNRFSDIMKEEARSARIGRMEDLEDIRREEEENRRKKMRKQQRNR